MNEISRVHNPFDTNEVARPSMAMGSVANSDMQRQMAEVQASIIVARQAPRDPQRAADRIIIECQRPRLAESAIYQFPRGGTSVTGPSIHLARSLARNWGNISFGMREMEQGEGYSVVKAFAWDLETNVREERDFNVQHQLQLKSGQMKRLTDRRDIYEIMANMGARRMRACILSLIPEDVVEMALQQCDETMRVKFTPTPELIKAMLGDFQGFNISKAQIEARLQRRIEAIEPAQMAGLKKIHNSLVDGMSNPEDWFEALPVAEGEKPKPTSGNAAAKDTLKRSAAPKAGGAKPAAEATAVDDSQPKQTLAEQLGDEIPMEGGVVIKADLPEADFTGEAAPARASMNQTWYKPSDGKLRYAHETQHGIKWYLEPQDDGQGADAAEVDQAAASDEADDAAAVAGDQSPADDDEPEPEYLAAIREIRTKLAAAQTVKAVDGIDRDWCNLHRGALEESQPALVRSLDRDIAARKTEIRAAAAEKGE